jgi:ABC-type dipeptide/oligopeptide/nickel transport system permease component
MTRYVVRRLIYTAVIMFMASIVVFLALRISPGDSSNFVISPVSSPERFAQLRHELGLDRPLIEQYAVFLSRMFSGNFGASDVSHRKVVDIIASGLPFTLMLAASAALLVYCIGIPMGVIAALRRDRWPDQLVTGLAVVGLGIPNFVLAILLVMIFAITFKLLPASGSAGPVNLILPAVVLAMEPLAITVRVVRTAVLDQLHQDYVRTLAAKGLSRSRIVWLHVLRNSLGPVISLAAVQFRSLIGYTLIVEVIFRWPGLGSQLVDAVLKRDYLVAQVLALLLTLVVIVINAFADIAYAFADPKVRVEVAQG